MKKILISGANPAWQKVLVFANLRKGKVNRADKMISFSSGKGGNFARAANIYGRCNHELIQFLAGENGRRVAEMFDAEKIIHNDILLADGETRVCSTCIDLAEQDMTELIEPAPQLTQSDIERFKNAVNTALKSADAFAVCGTMPSNAPNDIYSELTATALKNGKIVLADMLFDLDSVLKNSNKKVILKINADELKSFTGLDNTVNSLEILNKKYDLICAGITDGPDTAYLLADNKIFRYKLPKLENIINAIGCGDTASAVMLSEYLSSGDKINSFRMALGCASANCLSLKCAEFDKKFAEDFAEKINIEEL